VHRQSPPPAVEKSLQTVAVTTLADEETEAGMGVGTGAGGVGMAFGGGSASRVGVGFDSFARSIAEAVGAEAGGGAPARPVSHHTSAAAAPRPATAPNPASLANERVETATSAGIVSIARTGRNAGASSGRP
jgi:hypothetical protein